MTHVMLPVLQVPPPGDAWLQQPMGRSSRPLTYNPRRPSMTETWRTSLLRSSMSLGMPRTSPTMGSPSPWLMIIMDPVSALWLPPYCGSTPSWLSWREVALFQLWQEVPWATSSKWFSSTSTGDPTVNADQSTLSTARCILRRSVTPSWMTFHPRKRSTVNSFFYLLPVAHCPLQHRPVLWFWRCCPVWEWPLRAWNFPDGDFPIARVFTHFPLTHLFSALDWQAPWWLPEGHWPGQEGP